MQELHNFAKRSIAYIQCQVLKKPAHGRCPKADFDYTEATQGINRVRGMQHFNR